MKKFGILFLLFCSFFSSKSQNENNIWAFGSNVGLNFNSGLPVNIPGYQINTAEGCASIADSLGNLLFYTDGIMVWNKLHVQMPNGSGLSGNPSTTQSALIIPKPGSSTLFYIFTILDLGGSMRYSIVDMSLSGGNGDVILGSKNTLLHPAVSEKQTALKMCDGNIWVISHEWGTNNFFADLITPLGINPTIISSVGVVHSGGSLPYWNSVGQMKISQQGDRLALAIRDMGTFSVFDFDYNTGIVSNPIVLTGYPTAYGIEFSPDGSKLYGTQIVNGKCYQFNLLAGSPALIAASATLVGSSGNLMCSIQLANNGKIYIAKSVSQYSGYAYLDVINFPNNSPGSIGYVINGVSLNPKKSLLGLPNLMVAFNGLEIKINGINTICIGDSLTLVASNGISYIWSGGGINSTNDSITVSPTSNTTYYIIGNSVCGSDTDSVNVTVIPKIDINININGNTTICFGDSTTLFATGSTSYTWSGGGINSSNDTIIVSPSSTTTYYVVSSDSCSSDNDSIKVVVIPALDINVSVNKSICIGDSTILVANGGSNYIWSGGGINSTNDSIKVSPVTNTTYYVMSSDSCSTDIDTIQVFVIPIIDIQVIGNKIICEGDSIILYASGGMSYIWSGGGINSSNDTIIVSPSSTTTYYVVSSDSCSSDNDSIKVVVIPALDINVSGNKSICIGDSTILVANGGSNYLWSGGGINSTNDSIKVSPVTNTTYYVMSSDSCSTDIDTIQVFVIPIIDIQVSGNKIICEGDSVILYASGGKSYVWSGGGIFSTSSTVTVSPDSTTTYYVTGMDSCGTTDIDTIIVKIISSSIASFTYDYDACTGKVSFENTSQNPFSYIWNFGDGTLNDSLNPFYIYEKSGVYTISLVVNEGTSCESSFFETITVINPNETNLLIPNVFTPNADGMNDVFKIDGLNECNTYYLAIYNRWGTLIFQTNSPASILWDGTKGAEKKIVEGTYFYILEIEKNDHTKENKSGYITVF